MTTRTPRLRIKILACLLAAWPLFANAQASGGQNLIDSGGSPPAMRSIPDDAFRQWLREDNQIIEGILRSLTHIDALVTEIRRILVELPDPGQAQPPAPVAAPPAPQAIPEVAQKPVADEMTGGAGAWAPQIAGAALLALLAFWLGRRQVPAQRGQPRPVEPRPVEKIASKPVTTSPPAAPEPVAPPVEKRVSPPPAILTPPAAPAQIIPSTEPAPPGAPVARIPPPTSTDPGDQTLELAEIMLSMGLGHGATRALAEQIRNEPKQALRHWLKLLDIYRKNGQQEEFERSSEELRQHFNVRSEDWHATPGDRQSLEDYPHIAHRLTELWGKADCLVYMRNLLDDNRGGARSGFPQSVAEELLLLTALMRDVFGLSPVS